MAFLTNSSIFLFIFTLQIFFLIPLLLCSPYYLKDDSDTDIHDLLPKYNLPIGLLPGNIKSFSVSPQDNTFTVQLTHHCYIHFENQVAFYDTVITGKLDYGKVSQVTGIQAKKLFIWVAVDGMEVDEKSNMIEFHAGFFTQEMPAEAFQSIPTCREKGLLESAGFSSI